MSCEACGWAAAFCSMLAFGSFGVPIKTDAVRSVDIDPLVFQSYKTFMCFASSWLILLTGQEFIFTPWGIVSGLFWVPGGTATVYAIKAAGLASAIGIGSSCIVLSSFIWGIFVFDERVHSRAGACFAAFCLILGLIGMSYFSSPEKKDGKNISQDKTKELVELAVKRIAPAKRIPKDEVEISDCSSTGRSSAPNSPAITKRGKKSYYHSPGNLRSNSFNNDDADCDSKTKLDSLVSNPAVTKRSRKQVRPVNTRSNSFNDLDKADADDDVSDDDNETLPLFEDVEKPPTPSASSETVIVFGKKLPKREWGMFLAGIFGLWGGSIMVPMKLCKTDTKGSRFLLSFSIGASIVQLAFWLVRYLYNVHLHQSFSKAYAALPSFHIREMWLPGGLSGLLWSTGNLFSLITVFYLGQGVGYSLVQASILVSGLWGIFYFKEIRNPERISKWLLSSLLTLCGILLLSYQHVDE